jgi:hypothetical protein
MLAFDVERASRRMRGARPFLPPGFSVNTYYLDNWAVVLEEKGQADWGTRPSV